MKFVFSPAILGVLADDLLAALEPVAEKHFGAAGADVVQSLAAAAPAIIDAAGGSASSQPEAPVTVTTNGQATETDALIETAADTGLVLGEAALQGAAAATPEQQIASGLTQSEPLAGH